jgi:hypothetical protein
VPHVQEWQLVSPWRRFLQLFVSRPSRTQDQVGSDDYEILVAGRITWEANCRTKSMDSHQQAINV